MKAKMDVAEQAARDLDAFKKTALGKLWFHYQTSIGGGDEAGAHEALERAMVDQHQELRKCKALLEVAGKIASEPRAFPKGVPYAGS